MTAPGPAAIARAVQRRAEELAAGMWAQGTVTAVGANTVNVAVPGSSETITAPRLKSYSSPAVGDVVWLAGPPGSWVCIGALA